jgi:hypothetical protein
LVFEDSRETDKFGIPVTMFGHVPEIFYKMFGRVTKLASLIDIRMIELLQALDDNPQSTFSGRYGAELEGLVRQASASLESQELKDDVGTMRVEARRLRIWRNDVTHSVLPNPSEEEAFAWLPAAPAGQGQPATKSFVTSRVEIETLIKDQVKLIDDLRILFIKAQPEKSARMNEGRLHRLKTSRRRRLPFGERAEPVSD